MRASFLLLPALLLGCRPLPEAPAELDELCAYLFEHANDAPDASDPSTLTIEAGAVNLDAWLDLSMEITEEGYSVNTLSDDAVNALGDGERSLAGVKGAAVGYTSEFDLETLMQTLVTVSPADLYPNTYLEFRRSWTGDLDCFVAGECESVTSESFATLDYTVMQAEVNSMVQYRWVDTVDFGRVAIERTWMRVPASVSVDYLTVDQQYYVWMLIPNNEGGGSRSIQATWMVATLSGGAPPEDVVLNLVVNSMTNNASLLDEWLLAE